MRHIIISLLALVLVISGAFATQKAVSNDEKAYSCTSLCVELAEDGNINFFDWWIYSKIYNQGYWNMGSYSSKDLNFEQINVCCMRQNDMS